MSYFSFSLFLIDIHNKYIKKVISFDKKCPLILMKNILLLHIYFLKYLQESNMCGIFVETKRLNEIYLYYLTAYLNAFQRKTPLSYPSCSRKR